MRCSFVFPEVRKIGYRGERSNPCVFFDNSEIKVLCSFHLMGLYHLLVCALLNWSEGQGDDMDVNWFGTVMLVSIIVAVTYIGYKEGHSTLS